jgi:hypothetical protein
VVDSCGGAIAGAAVRHPRSLFAPRIRGIEAGIAGAKARRTARNLRRRGYGGHGRAGESASRRRLIGRHCITAQDKARRVVAITLQRRQKQIGVRISCGGSLLRVGLRRRRRLARPGAGHSTAIAAAKAPKPATEPATPRARCGRQRRGTCDLLAPKPHSPVRVTSEAAKPDHRQGTGLVPRNLARP